MMDAENFWSFPLPHLMKTMLSSLRLFSRSCWASGRTCPFLVLDGEWMNRQRTVRERERKRMNVCVGRDSYTDLHKKDLGG